MVIVGRYQSQKITLGLHPLNLTRHPAAAFVPFEIQNRSPMRIMLPGTCRSWLSR